MSRVLGIDTSCDDTSAAVVKDGCVILSSIVSSQSEIHKKYGGIVPELASRRHIEMIWQVVDEALSQAEVDLNDIDGIAVCYGPGLIGSLLVGCSFAKSVAYVKKKPLIAVNHLEGHLFSVFLEEKKPTFPFISLIVSGGHTSLYIAHGFGRYEEFGRTRDDAAGEAYDKVAKLLGLGYPGGPEIDRLAKEGDPVAFAFPRAHMPESYDFSFSGMKTSVKLTVEKNSEQGIPDERLIKNIAASFQAAMVDVLVRKVERAVMDKAIHRVTMSGGVAANSELRRRMLKMAAERGIELFLPSISFCTDNAAMIAAAGWHHFNAKNFAGIDLNPKAYIPL